MGREWIQTTLGEALNVGGGRIQTGPFGSQLHASDYVRDGIAVIMPVNITNNRVSTANIARINQSDANRLSRHIVKKGDIVYSRRGDVTRKALITASEAGMFCGTGCLLVRPGRGIDPRFLTYHLSTPENQEWIIRHAIGATMPNLNTGILAGIPLNVPGLATQKSIAHILGTLDDQIELNRQMNTTLEAMAQTLFKSWFVDFDPVIDKALAAGNPIPEPLHARAEARKVLGDQRKPLPAAIQHQFPDRFVLTEELGWVPAGWEVSAVGAEFDVTMGQSPPGNTYNEEGEGVPFFQGRTDFGFRYPSNRIYCTAPKRMASKGDTLVSVRAPVGDVNMAAESCCIGRGVSASRHKSGSRSFTYYAMQQLREHFKVYESEGTVFGSINQRNFNALPQLSVPAELIGTFEVKVNGFDEKIDINSQAASSLIKLRDTLLPKLLSGELRILEG